MPHFTNKESKAGLGWTAQAPASKCRHGSEEPPAKAVMVSPAPALPWPPATAACALQIIFPLLMIISLVISCNNFRLHREMPVSMGWGDAAGIMQEETSLPLQHQSHKISILFFFFFFFFLYFTSDYNCFHFSAKREYLKQCRRGRHRGLWALAAAK